MGNFFVKCGRDSLVWNQYGDRVDAEVIFYICSFPILFLEVFWGQHQSRFVLADDLHTNILKFVAGHGTAVQPASINIVSGCVNKHSNIAEHITWVLSELSVGVHKTLNRIGRKCMSLLK